MAQPEIVSYEQNENTSFYLCRGCRTHIALRQELIYKYPSDSTGLFDSVVNVVYGKVYPIVTGQNVEPASCIKCGLTLGSKFVSLMIQTAAIKPGRLMIEMNKVLYWTGKKMVYGDSEKPVPDE